MHVWCVYFNKLIDRLMILDVSKAISRKRCKIGGKLVLIIERKSYMSFRLVSKSVTLNDLERRNGRYFALFQRIRVASGAHCVHVRYLLSWWVLVVLSDVWILYFYAGVSLWSPYVIGRPHSLYFHPVISIFLLFFPRLISAAADWMSTILLHMVWP